MQIATEVYTSKPSTRVVAPLCGDITTNRFLLATTDISDNNEIHLVEYNTRNKTVYSECIYKHNGQIFGLSPCPYDPELCFAIVGCESDTKKGVLYKLQNLPLTLQSEEKTTESIQQVEPEEPQEEPAAEEDPVEGEIKSVELSETTEEKVAEQPDSEKPVESVDIPAEKEGEDKPESQEEVIAEAVMEESLPDDKKEEDIETKPTELIELAVLPRENVINVMWHPGNLEEGTLPHEVMVVYRTGFGGYQVADDGALKELFFYSFKEPCTAAAWDPLHTHLLAVAFHTDLKVLNITDNSVFTERSHAHASAITCMEYNPNRPSTLCTGGKDGILTIWHVSHHGLTVEKSIQAHTHWVTSVHFNPLHDQLVLSSSTDSSISVWRLFSVSSARMRERQHPDKLVVTLGGTRDSVYSTSWSPKNMWLFCGASYEGKLLFGSVPSDEITTLLDEI